MFDTLATVLFIGNNADDAYILDLLRWVDGACGVEITLADFNAAWTEYDLMLSEGDDVDAYDDHGSYDLSDEGYALASAGWGTDEDYGYHGGDEW
jgi:hypothetical protein